LYYYLIIDLYSKWEFIRPDKDEATKDKVKQRFQASLSIDFYEVNN